jgi:hypothetical protein
VLHEVADTGLAGLVDKRIQASGLGVSLSVRRPEPLDRDALLDVAR